MYCVTVCVCVNFTTQCKKKLKELITYIYTLFYFCVCTVCLTTQRLHVMMHYISDQLFRYGGVTVIVCIVLYLCHHLSPYQADQPLWSQSASVSQLHKVIKPHINKPAHNWLATQIINEQEFL